MNLLLLSAVVVGLVFLVLLVLIGLSGARGPTMPSRSSPGYTGRSYGAHPDFNSHTGEWEDWNGTPYGAIDDVLMDNEGDGGWDDFDGDGWD